MDVKLLVFALLGLLINVQFTNASSCNTTNLISEVQLEKITSFLNESTVMNLGVVEVQKELVPLLKQFKERVDAMINEYLKNQENSSLTDLLNAIHVSVVDNIAVLENEVPLSFLERVVPLYHKQLYKTVQDEINCRTNAFEDFKSRQIEAKELCFFNKFAPAFEKLTTETQSFMKKFINILIDGYRNATEEFQIQLQKWTTDIPIAINCGVPGCIDDYVSLNKNNILKDINIGHNIKDLIFTEIDIFIFNENVAKTMISKGFNGVYEGIQECYK